MAGHRARSAPWRASSEATVSDDRRAAAPRFCVTTRACVAGYGAWELTMSVPQATEAQHQYAEGFNASSALRFFGVRRSFPSRDRLLATLPVRHEHRGGLGSQAVNGGILAAMFDLAIGCTGAIVDPTRRSATMQLSMSFERPVNGDEVTIEAWVDRAGGATLFSSAVIRDGQGEICARCQGVVKLSKQKWENGTSPNIG